MKPWTPQNGCGMLLLRAAKRDPVAGLTALLKTKQVNYNGIDEYQNDLKANAARCEAAGIVINNKLLATIILNGLPDDAHWGHLPIRIMDVLHADDCGLAKILKRMEQLEDIDYLLMTSEYKPLPDTMEATEAYRNQRASECHPRAAGPPILMQVFLDHSDDETDKLMAGAVANVGAAVAEERAALAVERPAVAEDRASLAKERAAFAKERVAVLKKSAGYREKEALCAEEKEEKRASYVEGRGWMEQHDDGDEEDTRYSYRLRPTVAKRNAKAIPAGALKVDTKNDESQDPDSGHATRIADGGEIGPCGYGTKSNVDQVRPGSQMDRTATRDPVGDTTTMGFNCLRRNAKTKQSRRQLENEYLL
ncbi:hypothetical protein FN846DRAFT_903375 [Sphaerosporella brunnea]|uniref:Uncharacterized protein n=1 Tax=Sphaerosporella brunnea TaxID=1250544 RepID=A0A5J5F6U9_9PEZI|nr:hypothetical protein FN846DRAFT_903375 [Sphaerosporella brunnea]